MTAAIYARYSSENQRPQSIPDQLFGCQTAAERLGLPVLPEHIYTDEAKSGASWDRPGLTRMLDAAARRAFQVLLVDDLSRLARDNFFMLRVILDLQFHHVRLISVADGVDTVDPHAKLNIQFRGIFNELFLADLKAKTFRGQHGQKLRGFFVGEATFGYRSVSVGAVRCDKAGRERPEGHHMQVDPAEASVILRIFNLYASGDPVAAIVRVLNEEAVPGRIRSSKGWSTGSVTRILDNEKYVGTWVWNKRGNCRDPQTGCRSSFEKPKSEWVTRKDELLRIVPQSLWDKVRARRLEIRGIWPGGKGRRGFSSRQGGRSRAFPDHLLCGAMVCASCGRSIGLVSGKPPGYYGCLAARSGGCDNKVRVNRDLAERVILGDVERLLADPPAIRYVYEQMEQVLAQLNSDVPEQIRSKTAQLGTERRRLDHLVDFVADGRVSPGVRERLAQTEGKVTLLEAQIAELNRSPTEAKLPSLAWVEARCLQLRSLLQERTMRSALLLRELLGPITLTPVVPAAGRPYYMARTHFDTLKLLENLDPDGGPDPGATSIEWWTRSERLGTLARVLADVDICDPFKIPIYQVIAAEVAAMHDRRVRVSAIARRLVVDHHTVDKALRWFRSR